ncbi:MAG: PKD domain-containing protein [Putridiphycobacter sp.]|nr:PKD domain-containing protein [Putridiphycobacter sp.]
MKSVFLFFAVLFLLGAKHLSAQTASTVEGCLPLTVNFTAPTGYTTYFWDFDDGSTANIANPTNVFLTAGTYIVTFREMVGSPVVGTITISVYNKPVLTYTSTATEGCIPLTIGYTNTTTLNNGITLTGTSWVFSNGATSAGNSTQAIFTNAGSYGLSLAITTNLPSCNTSQQFNDIVTVASNPIVGFTTSPNPAFSCTAPLTVSFTNNSSSAWGPLTYNWTMGNGNTSTAINAPNQTYQNGNYTVQLTATDTIGCTNTFSKQVNVGGPVASFSISDTVCLNEIADIVNLSSPGFYNWTFDPSVVFVPGSSNNSQNPQVVYTTGGYHTISLAIGGGPCPDDTSITFFVEEVNPTFTVAPVFSCSDPLTATFTPNDLNGAYYSWVFGGDTIVNSDIMIPTHNFTAADTHTYTINNAVSIPIVLQYTSAAGCSDTSVQFVTIHKPNALIYPSVTDGCVPLTVQFDESSTAFSDIINWEWHFGDGTVYTDSISVDTSHTYTAVGDYYPYIIITTDSGCVDTSYLVPIHVGDTLSPSFSVSTTTLCPDDSVSFADITTGLYADSIDTWHFYSDNSKLFSCFGSPNATWAYTDSIGTHDVTMMVGYNGCYSESTITNAITVNGPIAGIDYSIDCDVPFDVNFINTSQGATSVLWDFGDGNTSTNNDPTYTYAATGDYIVTLIASNATSGCADDTASILVHIRNLEANLSVDSVLCVDVLFMLDASNSVDVYDTCLRGYTYYYFGIDERPLMTDTSRRMVDFSETGAVDIMLVVMDINNCTDTAIRHAYVYGVEADFSLSDTTVCFPLNLTGTDLSSSDTTLVSWQWFFPSGQTSTQQNPTVVLDGTIINGMDSTLLIVTDAAGCSSYDSLTFVIYDPVSTIDASSLDVCTGMAVNFQATDFTTYTNLNFSWDFGNGNTSNMQNPTTVYNSTGVYTVNMTYDEVGSGCGGTETLQVTVDEFPTASFTSSVDTVLYICPGENVVFTNTSVINSGYTFAWNFDNGSTSNVQDPGTVFTANGTYNVQLIVSTGPPAECRDTIINSITVQSPEGDFTTSIGNDTICKLDIVEFTIIDTASVGQYYWDFGDGTGAGQVSPVSNQYTFVPPSGQTFAKLIMSNPDGSCPVTKTYPINIYEVVADFIRNGNDIDTAICQRPFPFTNTSLQADVFYWDFGNGNTSNLQNPPAQNFEPGTYDVTLGIEYGAAGCTDSITKTIIIFKNPEAAIEGDTICEGQPVFLQTAFIDSAYSYAWSSNPVFTVNGNTTASVVDYPTSQTYYYLTVTDTNDCFAFTETFVDVYNPINLNDFDTTIILGDSIFLPMPYQFGNYTYTWQPDTGLSCVDCPNPYITPLNDIEYTLFIADNYGCFSDLVLYKVLINPETHIKLPTTFTPNGDGVNDIIYVEGWGIKELIEFKIFNRWGELVFETTDKEVGWDGYYKGMLQNNDVYLVQVKGLTWKDEEKTIEQYINLVR